MKNKQNIIAGLVMASATLSAFTACTEKEGYTGQDEISLKVTYNQEPAVAAYPGDLMTYDMTLEYEPGIVSVVAQLNNTDIENSAMEAGGEISVNYRFEYTIQGKDSGNTLDFNIIVTGVDGKVKTADIPLYVYAAKANIDIEIPSEAPSEWLITEPLVFDVNVTSEISLKEINTYKNGIVLEEMKMTEFPSPNSAVYRFSYQASAVDVGQSTAFRIEVMDSNGNIVSEDYTVTFTKPAPVDISEFYGISIGYQNNMEYGQFLNTATGEVYKIKDVHTHCADIDMVLFFSSSGGAGMSVTSATTNNASVIYGNQATIDKHEGTESDNIKNWEIKNNTYYKLYPDLSPADFAAVSSKEDIESYYISSESVENQLLNKLQPDNIFGFKTEDGKYGIVKVISRDASNSGKVVIDYKVVK